MLETFLTATGVELGKLVLNQFLELGKGALEDYVKDFLQDCIKEGVAGLEPGKLENPVAEAVRSFIRQFVDELRANGVEPAIIDHHYNSLIKGLVKDKDVRPLLGKAFESNGKATDINDRRLAEIWQSRYSRPGLGFPEDFDWRTVVKRYFAEVQGIIRANSELRALLQLDVAEEQLQVSRQQLEILAKSQKLGVDFNLQKYQRSLLQQYGNLPLESLGSAKYEREDVNFQNASLWNIFVEQNVRECQDYVPQISKIPEQERKRLQETEEIMAIAEEEVEERKARYLQQSPRPVLEILGAGTESGVVQPFHPYLVILGDPGSGKSTLLRYLALSWAKREAIEDLTQQIPLLIELRRYVQDKDNGECQDFVEFVDKGSNWINHLNRHQLDEWLKQGKALVMFDGLDEVVIPQSRSTIVRQIHDFCQDYPRVPIFVTSRVIGYHSQQLRDAGFQHYTADFN